MWQKEKRQGSSKKPGLRQKPSEKTVFWKPKNNKTNFAQSSSARPRNAERTGSGRKTASYRKEENLNKKEDALDKKLAEVEKAQKGIEEHRDRLKAIEEELNHSQEIMQRELERVAGMTKEEA